MIALAIIAGYLLGTIPFAIIVSRVVTRGRVDIRQTGSGNPGGFNTIREVGRLWGAVVIVLDGGKALVAALVGWLIAGDAGVYAAATAAIAGHIWPVWTRFRGGKGVATAGGAQLVAFPPYFPIYLISLLSAAIAFRNSAKSMIVAAITWIVCSILWVAFDWTNGWGPDANAGLIVFSVLSAAMILVKFRVATRSLRP
jgi:glycerol-3-phosphate acyltransferase PlsY